MKKLLLATLIIGFLTPFTIYAHPGNTDSYGCHTCKTNCPKWGLDYGEYHCHASKGLPQPVEPVRSIRSDTGAGTTVPAPEYKTPKSSPAPSQKTAPEIKTQKVETKIDTKVEPATTRPIPVEKKKNVFSRFMGWLF